MSQSTITREASQTGGKGFRLQKLRVVELMLNAIAECGDSAHIYGAIEHKEDVYIGIGTERKDLDYYEEDKNYGSSKFSLNSPVVRNSLVSFIDLWLGSEMSDSLFLGFYATNEIGKENNVELVKKIGISLPKTALLTEVVAENYSTEVVDCIKAFAVSEYSTQYENKDSNGFLSTIQKWTNENWQTFLGRIDWRFGQENHEEVEQKVLRKIKDCPLYSIADHEGKEEIILGALVDKFDKRQMQKDRLKKFVHAAEVNLLFKEIAGKEKGTFQKDDPTWAIWSGLEPPTDKRNLVEKIKAVSDSFSTKKIGRLSRRLCASKIEHKQFESDKDFLSIKYRIYDKCEEELDEILAKVDGNKKVEESDVEGWINQLKQAANLSIGELSKTYKYTFKSEKVIEGIILELFDRCFLSFDDE